jgi:hypothetical protein
LWFGPSHQQFIKQDSFGSSEFGEAAAAADAAYTVNSRKTIYLLRFLRETRLDELHHDTTIPK